MIRKAITTTLVGPLAMSALAQPAAAITTSTKAQLQFIVEEEKLARDVYTTLAASSGIRRFTNIARSEQTHVDEVRALLKKYGVKDPTATTAVGVFVNKDLQALYNDLVARGRTSSTAALAVGVLVEQTDINDLDVMLKTIKATDIRSTLELLRAASVRHLAAFQR